MKRLSILLLVALMAGLVVACKDNDRGSTSQPPVVVTPPPPPPEPPITHPERGTLLRSGCSADYVGVKWFQYADGEGGTYSERDNTSIECGYIPISLDVEIDNTYGDRFKPVVVSVDYTENGEPAEWDYEIGIGKAVKVDQTTLHIFGDGRVGEDTFVVAGEEYRYTIREEPRCTPSVPNGYSAVDCQGYAWKGSSKGLIYYGEDDDEIVTWEVFFIYNKGNWADGLTIVDESHKYWQRSLDKIELYNKTYERFGVHIRFKMVGVGYGRHNNAIMSGRQVTTLFNGIEADILAGIGGSDAGTCGIAMPRTRFKENSRGIGMNSDCGGLVDLHEIGHSVGLAHGPDNRDFANSGYIWREFGHGTSTPFCGSYHDLMSYASRATVITNSRQTCRDYKPWADYSIKDHELDNPAGSRTRSDHAYHLNRVRYDVSLVSCKRDAKCENLGSWVEPLPVEDTDLAPAIRDNISDIPRGAWLKAEFDRQMSEWSPRR